ncbi:hypothetical protein FRC06_004925 [Ceratobasidium sp. 370]|nr:hypothetical protein FRC06_004925 [Ceratobasidium sp. 370]
MPSSLYCRYWLARQTVGLQGDTNSVVNRLQADAHDSEEEVDNMIQTVEVTEVLDHASDSTEEGEIKSPDTDHLAFAARFGQISRTFNYAG